MVDIEYSNFQGNPVKLTDPFGLSPSLNISGMGHAALNLLGIIPSLDICDAINAVWYLAEGDYANVAISAVAVLPMLRSTIGNGLKWGAKSSANINKVADTIKLGGRIARNSGALLLSGAQTAEVIRNIHANYVETGEVFTLKNVENVISLEFSVAGMGLAGASLEKRGASLKNLWQGEVVAEVATISNAAKKISAVSSKLTSDSASLTSFVNAGMQLYSCESGSNTNIDGAINNGQPLSNHRIVPDTDAFSLLAAKQPPR